MSWLFSRALVGEYLPDACLGGKPFALWRTMPTAREFLLRDKTTERCPFFQSGQTFELLTEDLGEELLTLYLADFRARILVPLETQKEFMG